MTTNLNVIFSNPEKKPLEELTLRQNEDGVMIKVPALHKRWAAREAFAVYISLVGSGGKIRTGADLDEWLFEGDWFLKDMQFLLGLKHYEFWSHMVHQPAALGSVLSFLKKATPFYLNVSALTSDERVIKLYADILAAVVRVVCRIITNKESDEEWISKTRLKELIYSNFLISIPMVFDLIIALGESNLNILRKVVATVFQIEPKYKKDLTLALQYSVVAFETILQQAENEGAIGDDEESRENLETPYDDLVLLTLDCAFTLSILLEIFPEARKICCDINLGQSISNFYDNAIPYLYKNIDIINGTANSLKWLNEARIQFLKAFRNIVYFHIETVLGNPEESLMPAENFVAIMTECLSERAFVIDYQREYPIELDVDILKQACKNLDDFKIDFVAKGYKDEAESESFGMIGNLIHLDESDSETEQTPSTSNSVRPDPEGAASIDYDADKPSTSRAAMSISTAKGRAKSEPKARDMDQEVISVLDVLPHLGDGFVRRVLCRYDNSEDAIAAILEQNLPPDLINSDQSEVYIPPDAQDVLYQQTGIKRFNIFDGDKYDVMTQDNPDCLIKIGKGFPNAPQNLGDMLDDKTDMNAVRHRYQEYTLVEEGSNEYDDEYDDSYEAVLESESRAVRTRQMRATLADIQDKSDDEEEESDDAVEANNEHVSNGKESYGKQMNFCENPEVIRARYEANRAAKYGNNAGRAPAQQSKPKDVVGAPKGHGQQKDVTVNRHKKGVHKSSRANHNRKAGAAFKRSKGMMS